MMSLLKILHEIKIMTSDKVLIKFWEKAESNYGLVRYKFVDPNLSWAYLNKDPQNNYFEVNYLRAEMKQHKIYNALQTFKRYIISKGINYTLWDNRIQIYEKDIQII